MWKPWTVNLCNCHQLWRLASLILHQFETATGSQCQERKPPRTQRLHDMWFFETWLKIYRSQAAQCKALFRLARNIKRKTACNCTQIDWYLVWKASPANTQNRGLFFLQYCPRPLVGYFGKRSETLLMYVCRWFSCTCTTAIKYFTPHSSISICWLLWGKIRIEIATFLFTLSSHRLLPKSTNV